MISESSRTGPRYLSDLYRNGTPAALSDSELLERFTAERVEHGETAELAFAALLARHGPMVLRVCRAVLGDRHEVDDAFQATFLVLAVRARSIRRRGSVASWLHGVALRVAASERSRAMRRKRHELARAVMTSSTTQDAGSDSVCDHELKLVIHEEIDRLPERHRAAVVLCYLEGLTHEMAAERLGWPLGSVKSRLAWARERLRVRLAQRGFAPTTVPFNRPGSPLGVEPAPVVLGTSPAESTIRGALKAGMEHGALTGIVSTEALALMEGAIKSMMNARLMLMACRALIGVLITAGAGVVGQAAIRHENPPRASQPGQEPPLVRSPPGAIAAKRSADQSLQVMQVQVVDPEGRRLPGVDVVVTLYYARGASFIEPVIERSRSDGEGQARLEIRRERQGARVHSGNVWAYEAGRAISGKNVSFSKSASPFAAPLTLDQPAKWTITVIGADDRPVAGLRLAPHAFRRTDRRNTVPEVPREWLEWLTVITDANGVATLNYLSGVMAPLSIRVGGPGVAPHTLPLGQPQGRTSVLKLGRPGRLVGIVRSASGAPMPGVPVELWVQGPNVLWSDFGDSRGNRRIAPDEILRLGPEPLKTGPQGAFQTPATLLSRSTYRVAIRKDGFVPFVSDWVTLNGERAVIPDIRLQALQKLTGQINDRQGRAVAGARVFLPSGGSGAVTDAEGRFGLAGIQNRKAIVLAEQPGFRLQGWLVDPSSQAELGSLTLVRASEIPEKVMKPLADPIPPEESRALANRLLEPYLQEPLENENDGPRLAAIRALGAYDLERAIDLLQNGNFRDADRQYQLVRNTLAERLAVKDPARAEAMVASIPDPLTKVSALTDMARALPASERAQKRALLEKATTLLRVNLQRQNDAGHLRVVSPLAEQWLEIGDRDRARLLLEDEKVSTAVFQRGFLRPLAGLDPEKALAQLQKQPALTDPSYRARELTEIAFQIATDHPARAEEVFRLREGVDDRLLASSHYGLGLCRRLARVDPTRARRVAASLNVAGARACGWAYVALGLAETDKAGVSEAIDRAIQEIDRLRETGPAPEPATFVGGFGYLYSTNPAAMILPIVERIAPDRLADVFWRAVALHSRIDTDLENRLRRSNIGEECLLLARYDRQVAAAVLEPVQSYLASLAARTTPDEVNASVIAAMGCIEPRAAVTLVESLTPPRDSRRADPAFQARIKLAEFLGMPPESRWMRLWPFTSAQRDD